MPRKTTRTVFLGMALALMSLYLLVAQGAVHSSTGLPQARAAAKVDTQLPFVEDYRRAKEAVKENILFKANLAIARGLQYGADGTVRGWENLHKQFVRASREREEQHPVQQLVTRGKRRWEAMLKR